MQGLDLICPNKRPERNTAQREDRDNYDQENSAWSDMIHNAIRYPPNSETSHPYKLDYLQDVEELSMVGYL